MLHFAHVERSRAAGCWGSWFDSVGLDRASPALSRAHRAAANNSANTFPVGVFFLATAFGEPAAMSLPPRSPPSGPSSMR